MSVESISNSITKVHESLLSVRDLPVDLVKTGQEEYSIICAIYRSKSFEMKFNLFEPRAQILLMENNKIKEKIELPLGNTIQPQEAKTIGNLAYKWCLE